MDVLRIVVVEARDLRLPNDQPPQNPFAKVQVGTQFFRTLACKGGGGKPHWNQTFETPLPADVSTVLLAVYDEASEPGGTDASVGDSMNISLRRLREQRVLDCGVHLFFATTRVAGEVHLHLSLHSKPASLPPPPHTSSSSSVPPLVGGGGGGGGELVKFSVSDDGSLLPTLLQGGGDLCVFIQLGAEKRKGLMQRDERRPGFISTELTFPRPTVVVSSALHILSIEVWKVPGHDTPRKTLIGFGGGLVLHKLLRDNHEDATIELLDGNRKCVARLSLSASLLTSSPPPQPQVVPAPPPPVPTFNNNNNNTFNNFNSMSNNNNNNNNFNSNFSHPSKNAENTSSPFHSQQQQQIQPPPFTSSSSTSPPPSNIPQQPSMYSPPPFMPTLKPPPPPPPTNSNPSHPPPPPSHPSNLAPNEVLTRNDSPPPSHVISQREMELQQKVQRLEEEVRAMRHDLLRDRQKWADLESLIPVVGLQQKQIAALEEKVESLMGGKSTRGSTFHSLRDVDYSNNDKKKSNDVSASSSSSANFNQTGNSSIHSNNNNSIGNNSSFPSRTGFTPANLPQYPVPSFINVSSSHANNSSSSQAPAGSSAMERSQSPFNRSNSSPNRAATGASTTTTTTSYASSSSQPPYVSTDNIGRSTEHHKQQSHQQQHPPPPPPQQQQQPLSSSLSSAPTYSGVLQPNYNSHPYNSLDSSQNPPRNWTDIINQGAFDDSLPQSNNAAKSNGENISILHHRNGDGSKSAENNSNDSSNNSSYQTPFYLSHHLLSKSDSSSRPLESLRQSLSQLDNQGPARSNPASLGVGGGVGGGRASISPVRFQDPRYQHLPISVPPTLNSSIDDGRRRVVAPPNGSGGGGYLGSSLDESMSSNYTAVNNSSFMTGKSRSQGYSNRLGRVLDDEDTSFASNYGTENSRAEC